MEFIVDFYKELETLDLIIFWGIIIVIVLLLIFALILLSKNKKLKKIMDKNDDTHQNNKFEELPIKNEKASKTDIEEKKITKEENAIEEISELNSIILPELPSKEKEIQENITNPIKTEHKFIAEEHVIEYNKDLFSLSNIKKANENQEETVNHNVKTKNPIEMPTGPYQRNILREMSLSQTSPIGITIPKKKDDKNIEMVKDLEDSLNVEQQENIEKKEISLELNKKRFNEQKKEQSTRYQENINQQEEIKIVKKELTEIKNDSPRKTEIKTESISQQKFNYEDKTKENTSSLKSNFKEPNIEKNVDKDIISSSKKEQQENTTRLSEITKIKQERYPKENSYSEEKKILPKEFSKSIKEIPENNIDPQVKELFNSILPSSETQNNKSSSEKYLEEVSRKLAEAEIPDEIERTNYELEQEENAIISYKELMEKKDSIQTIDEEEAIISIEELMNRNNQKEEATTLQEDTKLYKLTEEEENDDFIKELKQFRNDL